MSAKFEDLYVEIPFPVRAMDTFYSGGSAVYLMGKQKPHYPVPAIRYTEEFVDDGEGFQRTLAYRPKSGYIAFVGEPKFAWFSGEGMARTYE